MEGFGDSQNSKERRPWTTDMMRENRDQWNLAADVGVLQYLEQFSNKLLNETENTLNLLDSFESELNTSCVQVSNVTNRFLSLADSQFVENRVYDDEETPTPETVNIVPSAPVKSKQEIESEIYSRLKESVNNGLNVLNTKFEAVEVANSDSEDEDSGPMGVLYKPINIFNNRPLPHLIGSVEFMKDPTVGLEELPSDDEESVEDESSSESKELAEENEDSEPESDRPNIILPNSNVRNDETADILFKQPSSSFADHLANRLANMENESRSQKQQSSNLFSTTPPPLDDSYEDDFGSNDNLIFGGNNRNEFHDNDDLFVPKSKSDGFDDLFETNSKTSFWDDNKNNIANNEAVGSSNGNDSRKKVMQDLEKRFSQNLKSNDDNLSDDLSPSPPPLNDDENNDFYHDDSKLKSKGLFDYKPEDNDESDDLFGSSTKNSVAASSSSISKKKIFPGAVNVMGNNANIFKDSIKQHNNNLGSKSDVIDDKTDSDIVAKAILSLRKNRDEDDEEDDEEALFKSSNQQEKSSSRSSSVKLSESFQDDNISIKSNKSAGLFDDILTNTKKNSIKKTMDDLFSDLNNCDDDDDEDDLFSSSFSSKGNKNSVLISNNNTDLFNSGSTISKSDLGDDLFSDIDAKDDFFTNFGNQKPPESKISKPISNNIKPDKNPAKPLSLFDDEYDDTDIFGSDFLNSKGISSSNSKKVSDNNNESIPKVDKNKEKLISSSSALVTEISSSKTTKNVGGLFSDEDDNLFGGPSDTDRDIFSSDIFSKKPSKVAENITKENKKSVVKTDPGTNDLFSDSENSLNEDSNLNSNKQKFGEQVNKTLKEDVSNLFEEENDSSSTHIENKNGSGIPAVSNHNIKTASVKSISLFSDNINNSFADDNDDLFSTAASKRVASKIIPSDHDDSIFHKISETATNKQSSPGSSYDSLPSKKSDAKDIDVRSENIFVKPSKSSNDTLLVENNSSKIFDKNSESENQLTSVPPLPDIDDSPLFSDDKNHSVVFDGYDNDDDLFKKHTEDSKTNVTEEFRENLSPKCNFDDSNVNIDCITKQTESDDVPVILEKTAASVPFSSTNEVVTSDDLFSNESNFSNNDSLFGENDNSNNSNDKNSSSVKDKKVPDFDNPSKPKFDTNHSLPEVPSDPIKKPQVPAKPSKPEPPKSLNIRAPIALPDPFGGNLNKDSSNKEQLDIPDGGIFSSEKNSLNLPSPRITPGKLNLEKSLNINPKALLPGARPASFKKSATPLAKENHLPELSKESVGSPVDGDNVFKLDSDSKGDDTRQFSDLFQKVNLSSSSLLTNTNSEPVLHSIAKDRAKIQVKRRPPTRKARREAIRQSTIENNNEDDETDNSSSVTTQSNKEPKSASSSIFDQPSNILSPSTDEEDLFGVPPLDLPPDYSKVSVSPGDIFDAPKIISPDLSAANSNNSNPGNNFANENGGGINSSEKGIDSGNILKSNSEADHAVISNLIKNRPKENSDDIFYDNESKLTTDIANLTSTDKAKNNQLSDNLFSDIDDSDLFSSNSNKLGEHIESVSKDADIFSSKSDKSKESFDGIIRGDSSLFSDQQDKSKDNLDFISNNQPDLFSNKSEDLKENLNYADDDLDLFSSESKNRTEKSGNIVASNDLRDNGAPNNIICGVFNTGVVNICDKLSITPPNDDELFPPSDWTLSNKKENTVISVPEKIKSNSLFGSDNVISNDDDDSLFSASKSSSSALKGNLNIQRKTSIDNSKNKTKKVKDLFSNDEEGDDLFSEIKVKNDPPVPSKSSTSGLQQKPKDSLGSAIKKSSTKSKSLFGDDNADDDSDIFGSSFKTTSLPSKNTLHITKNLDHHSGSVIKKSGITKPTKLTPAITKNDEGFIDPLAALGNKD